MKAHMGKVGRVVVLDPRKLDRWINRPPPVKPSAIGVIVAADSPYSQFVEVSWSTPGAVRDELLWVNAVWLADLFLIPELP